MTPLIVTLNQKAIRAERLITDMDYCVINKTLSQFSHQPKLLSTKNAPIFSSQVISARGFRIIKRADTAFAF